MNETIFRNYFYLIDADNKAWDWEVAKDTFRTRHMDGDITSNLTIADNVGYLEFNLGKVENYLNNDPNKDILDDYTIRFYFDSTGFLKKYEARPRFYKNRGLNDTIIPQKSKYDIKELYGKILLKISYLCKQAFLTNPIFTWRLDLICIGSRAWYFAMVLAH